MKKIYIEYSIDGHDVVKEDVPTFDMLKSHLLEIREKTSETFASPFSVDVVIEGVGRISIGLADQTVLCFSSADLETMLTSVGDLSAVGDVVFYFGDYSIMSKKHVIPYALGLSILEHWTSTGELGDMAKWTHDLF